MKQTINLYQFQEAFKAIRPDNFSYEGLEVLFDYLEAYEEDTGEEMELDVISLCCEFSEESVEGVASDYSIDLSDCENYEDKKEAVKTWLEDNGAYVGEVVGGFVYRLI